MTISKKVFITLIICIISAVSTPLKAEYVSQKQAKKIAEQFFNAVRGEKLAPPKYVYNGRRLTTNHLFSPFYVFNHPLSGFVIISAENKTFPILGFNLTENFNPENISEQTKMLLTLYARHIEHIRYDSQIPYQAIELWQNLPLHIAQIINSDYSVVNQNISLDQAHAKISALIENNDFANSASATYFPGQWSEIIDYELFATGNVALSIIDDNANITPLVIYGKKGDFYRFSLDQNNHSWMRLLPSEIISKGMIASLGNPPMIENKIIEEQPFSFYDDFIAENKKIQEAQQAAIEEATIVTKPIIRRQGGGHYTITIPEEIQMVRVFSLSGASVISNYYRNTNSASFNIEAAPNGFYFAVVYAKSGKNYGLKIFR